MKMNLKYYFIISLMLILLTVTAANATDSIDGLNVTSDFNQSLIDAQNQNKDIIVIFDQEGCYYCDVLKNNELNNPEIQDALNKDYITVISDVNENPEIAVNYQIFGTPTILHLEKNGTVIKEFEGYDEAKQFLEELTD